MTYCIENDFAAQHEIQDRNDDYKVQYLHTKYQLASALQRLESAADEIKEYVLLPILKNENAKLEAISNTRAKILDTLREIS